ncbi:MAG TPA: OmpA family protein [Vicinamibacterales bacterium]|nr:OmpA family protein [Vicinamibacterales bacterium]
MAGDTGLWWVPTAEVLPHGRVAVSLFRTNVDYEVGFTDVSTWPVTVAVGVRDRVELFGAFESVVRIDRDVRPLFLPAGAAGGAVAPYPRVARGWTGNQVGDLWLGAKVALRAPARAGGPPAVALRGQLKLPTGDEAAGVSTGAVDAGLDAVVSGEVGERVEVAGRAGVLWRGDPEGFELVSGLRWGLGVGLPTRRALRLTAELHGEAYLGDEVRVTGPRAQAVDGSVIPAVTPQERPVVASLGLTYQSARGVFVGAGLNWSLRVGGRSDAGAGFSDETGDSLGFQLRLGYHPGVRVYVPPPPPPPPPPPVVNRPPTVRARCEPCTVEVGQRATVTAEAQDPDGDVLRYQWRAPAGTLAQPTDRQTAWTAPLEPGPVPVTVTVDDGKGGTASDTVTLQVVRPPVKEYVFEDVHFDFDRYTLRPEATRVLEEVVTALQQTPELRLEIEGHTCNIGTAEYNLALGERRAQAVRDYLVSRGISADRLRTVSYGEERPKHDNAREETRRLNRRAALVVRVQR